MGELQLSGILIVYLLYGLYALYREREKNLNLQLCILVNKQEENIEGIIRYLVKRLRMQCFSGQLVIINVGSSDHTGEILVKLAYKMSFIVREIKSESRIAVKFAEKPENGCYLVDIREKKGFPVELFTVMKKLENFKAGLVSGT